MTDLNKQTHYCEPGSKWPKSLKTAEEISEKLELPLARIKELTELKLMPHWLLDEGIARYQMNEVKDWAAENFIVRTEGQKVPVNIRIMASLPDASGAPESIRNIPGLKRLPLYDTQPGVYFLIDQNANDEIVYVGNSTAPITRMTSHSKEGRKKFTAAFMVPVPEGRLFEIESALIQAFKPKYNATFKTYKEELPDEVKAIVEEVFFQKIK